MAVVTEGQGYSFTRQKIGFDPDPSERPVGFSTLDAVPHIPGSDDSTMLYYANQPGKRENMTQVQAEAVITSMADLALSLRARRLAE